MNRYLTVMTVVNKCMDFVAGTALLLIMFLTSCDVVLRYLGYPIQGSYDLVSFGAVFVIGFALPKTTWDRMQVTVDVLVDKIPDQRIVLDVITRLISIALFALVGWNLTMLGASFFKTGESTMTIALPLYPVAYALGISAFLECMALVADLIKVILQRRTA
jgi:TRAP-type C4-dicarboxylate transport system permease small subunit